MEHSSLQVCTLQPHFASPPKPKATREFGMVAIAQAPRYAAFHGLQVIHTFHFDFLVHDNLRDIEDFFSLHRGKLSTFWLPSWHGEIVPASSILIGADELEIEPMDYDDLLSNQAVGFGEHVFLLHREGDLHVSRVLSAAAGDPEVLTLATPVARDFLTGEFIAGFLYHVRFLNDELELSFSGAGQLETTLAFQEVPNVLTVETVATPSDGGTLTGAGSYGIGDTVEVVATASIPTTIDVGLDMVFVVDESGSMQDARALLRQVLSGLDGAFQALGVGSATEVNRYGLVGFSSATGGTHGGATDEGHLHCDLGTFAAFESAIDELVTAPGGTIGEDGYEGVGHAVSDCSWRTDTTVARIVVLITDENRDAHIYVTGGSTQAEQFTALAGEIAAIDASLIAVVSWCGLKDGLGNAVMGYNFARKTWRADGAGGFTNGTGGNATTAGNTSGAFASGIRDEYHDLAMEATIQGQVWDYQAFRVGAGTCNVSGTTVTRLSGSFTGLSGGGTFTINGTDYTINTVTLPDTVELTGSAGTLTKADWSVVNAAKTSFLAAFTDAVAEQVEQLLVWNFVGWYDEHGVLLTADTSYSFTITQNRILEARFEFDIGS